MHIRKKILSSVISSSLMLTSAIALAGMAQAGELLQPDSNWAVSKIAASSDAGGGAYCALARRFSNSTVLTLARNSRDESSMAIDFQKDAALDKNTTYYVVIKPGNGQERSFNVHPVSGRALVVRLGKDYPFYDALTRASQLDVKVAADTYSFAITDFDSGQQQLNGCLAALAEPAAGDSAPITSASMPVATDSGPTPLPSADTAPEKPVRVASSAPVSDDQLQSLHEENVRLRKALEEERRSYESQILQQDKNSSVASELTEKIDLLKHENDELRQQASAAKTPSTDTKAAASMAGQLKALQDENASLKQQTDSLTAQIAQANTRQNDVNFKLNQTNAQMAAADKKASEAEEKLAEASQKLAQANQKSTEADQKLAQADQKLAQAGQKMSADATARQSDADRKLADATAKLDAANKKMLDADQKLALADQKLSDASQKAAQINQTLATNNQQQSEADQKLADANLKLDQANKKLADADQKLAAATQKSEQVSQTVAQASQQQQSLQQKLDAADQKVADADRKLDDANRQLVALSAEKTALLNQKTAQNTQAQIAAAQKLAAAQQALDDVNKKVADANQKMAAAAAEQAAADKEKADLAMQKAMGQSATDQKTAAANQKLDEANKRLAEADQKLNDANRELAAATAAKAALATQKVALNTQAQTDAAQKLAALQKKLDDANAKLSDASAKMAAADKEKADLAYQKTLNDSAADQKLAAANAKLEDANKRMAAADQKMAEATQKLAAKPVSLVVSDNNKLADASQRLAQATQRDADAQRKLDEANRKSADADRKLADAAQKLAAADSKLVAAGRSAVNSPTPLPPDNKVSDGVIASLKAQVSALEADNIRLRASLKTAQASPQAMSATTVSADSSVMQLHAVEEQLSLVQKERDRLANQIQGMSQGKDSHLMAISSNDWNLEEATKRYNEAEREIRRLGLQLEQDRGQCEADKKKIEYQLFDPAIATQAQIQKVNSLQQAVDKAQAELVAERSHVASLETQLKGGATVALQSTPETSSGQKLASADSKPDASAKDLSAIMPAAGTPGPDMTPDLDSTGYRNTPATPIQVSAVTAPGTISNRDGTDQAAVSAPPTSANISPVAASAPPPVNHGADLSRVAGSAAAMVSGTHLATAADIQSLLGKSVTLKDGVTKVSGASDSGAVSYSWQSGALFGSAEQQTMGNPAAFDDHVAQYLAHTKSHCAGSFAAKPGETRTEGSVKVSAYEIACVGDSADASNASASLLFYSQNGVFTAIAHEGSLDDMDVAMDVRDQLLNKVLQDKVASN